MAITGITPILNVSNVPASLAWFEALGWKRGFTYSKSGMILHAQDRDANGEANFAGIIASHTDAKGHEQCSQIFLCQGGQGSRGTIMPAWPGDDQTDGVWMTWWVDSITSLEAMHAECVKHGFTITMPPTTEPWGVREFHLRHLDGHMVRVSAFAKA